MNIIDSLVVTLGLDSSGLKQGAKEATAATEKLSNDMVNSANEAEKGQTEALDLIVKGLKALGAMQKKTADDTVRNNKAMVSATEKLAESGEKAIRTFGALFLLFAGARSIKDFAADMLNLDAATGRAAANMGQTPEVLSGIGRAVERMGGTFGGAVGGLKGLSDAFEQMRTTGNSAIMEPLARLQGLSGKRITFGRDVHENFLSIAEALKAEQAKDPAMADFLGRQILGDEGLTNLAKKGRAGVLAEEAQSPRINKDQSEAAQKLQAQLAAVRQGFQDIGNSVLMDFGPAMLKGIQWVKDLIEANRGLIESKVSEWVKDVGTWFQNHRADVEAFGKAVGDLATAAASLATAFASQSPAMQAMEAFAVLMGGRVLGAVSAVSAAATALGTIPVPAWALAAMGLSAAAQWQGAKDTAKTLGSDDPTKNDVVVDPESGMATKVAPGEGNQGTGPNTGFNPTTGAITWFKSLFGFGVNDPKTKDNIEDTAKSTKGILDLMKSTASSALSAFQGVTSSSGGLGGSGQHAGGSAFPGASLGDHARGGIGRGAAAMAPNARESFNFWMSKGLTREQAAGLVGMEQGESSFNPRAVGDHGEAHGAFQWHADRRARIQAATGIDIDHATHAQQLEAAYWEFQHTEQAAWSAIKQGRSASDAARSGVYLYERPGDKAGQSVVRGGMGEGWLKRFNDEDAKAKATPTAQAPVPAGTPAAAVGDAAAFAAEQRLKAGGNDPKDRALVEEHRRQQNTPTTAPKAGPQAGARPAASSHPTWEHAMRHTLGVMAHANRLLHHHGEPVPVDVTERGARRLAHPINEALRHRLNGAHRAGYNHAIERAGDHAEAYRSLHRMAMAGVYGANVTHNVDSSSETHIKEINIHTAATDARGIAADIEPHLRRGQAAGRADYGLA